MAGVFFCSIMYFYWRDDATILKTLFDLAAITYGPLLGLFAFGLISEKKPIEMLVPFICIASAIATFFLRANSQALFFGYQLGFETLIVNGLLTFAGLALASKDEAPSGAR